MYLSPSQVVSLLLSWQDSRFVRSREILSISRSCPRWIMLWSVKKLQGSRKTSGRSFTEAAFRSFIRILSSTGSNFMPVILRLIWNGMFVNCLPCRIWTFSADLWWQLQPVPARWSIMPILLMKSEEMPQPLETGFLFWKHPGLSIFWNPTRLLFLSVPSKHQRSISVTLVWPPI